MAWSARLFLLEMILPSFLCVRCIVTFFDPASVFLPRPEAEGESLLFRQRQSVLRGRLPGEFVAEAPLPAVPSRTRCGDAEGPQPGPEGGSPLCCPRRGSGLPSADAHAPRQATDRRASGSEGTSGSVGLSSCCFAHFCLLHPSLTPGTQACLLHLSPHLPSARTQPLNASTVHLWATDPQIQAPALSAPLRPTVDISLTTRQSLDCPLAP